MDTKRFSVWGDLLALTCVLLGATLAAGVCMAVVTAAAPGLGRGALMFFTYTVQFSLAVAGGLVWLKRRGGSARLRFGASWSDGPMILGGIVMVTAAGIVLEPLIALFPESYFERLAGMIGRGGWAVLTTVVAAPLLEEIFFRGLVLERLSRRWSAPAAVFASALLFGLIHLPILPQMINAFVVAVVMGYIYLLTRSLIPVIVIHAINNAVAYMLLELTGAQSTDTREMIADDTLYIIVYAVSALILIASLVFMNRRVQSKSRRREYEGEQGNKTDEIPLKAETADE